MLSGNSGSNVLNVSILAGFLRAFNMLIYDEDCSFPNFFDHGCSCTATLINISLKNFTGLPRWLSVKEFTVNAGVHGLIPRSERFSGEGNGNPLQYCCLENSMDRGAWQGIAHGVAKSGT